MNSNKVKNQEFTFKKSDLIFRKITQTQNENFKPKFTPSYFSMSLTS
jgi:hypothetical protein